MLYVGYLLWIIWGIACDMSMTTNSIEDLSGCHSLLLVSLLDCYVHVNNKSKRSFNYFVCLSEVSKS